MNDGKDKRNSTPTGRNMGVFTDCQIALELDSSLGFKKKSALKGKIVDNGGTISFIVTKNVSCTSIAGCAPHKPTRKLHIRACLVPF